MSTTLAKNETVSRKWYVLDAAGKPLEQKLINFLLGFVEHDQTSRRT